MSEELSRQIVRRILANVGAVPNAPAALGLMDRNLLLNKTFDIKYDTGMIRHDMYAGHINLNNSKLKGLLIDLTIDNIPEFLFIFRLDNLPIHAAKVLYDQIDLGETFIRIYNDKKETWAEAGMYFKARLLADFEQITSHGYLWNDYKEYDELYKAAVKLMNFEG